MARRLLWPALLCALMLALLAPTSALAKRGPRADMVLINGYVYTVDDQDTVAQAVAVKDSKIVYVGDTKTAVTMVGAKTKVVNLRGKLLLPGFIDSHAHAGMTVSQLYSVQLYGVPTLDEYLSAIADFAAANPDLEFVRGEGWSNTVVPGIGPLASDLDKVVPDRPALITSEDYHSSWVNSKMLEYLQIDGTTPNPLNGVIERIPGSKTPDTPEGVPSGTLRESASEAAQEALPDYTVPQYEDGIRAYEDWVAGPLGITGVFDPLLTVGKSALPAYENMAQSGGLTYWARGALEVKPTDDTATNIARFEAEQAKHATPLFQTNAVKIFEDGVVEGHTAYLNEPYADAADYAGDPSYRGSPLWDQTALQDAVAAYDEAGFQLHFHGIGDAANTAIIDALAYAREQNGAHDWRPGITHLQLVDPADFARFADLDVTAAIDPYWAMKDDYYTYLQLPYLGLPRADEEYPIKSFFDAGVRVASASDFPVTYPPDPLDGIGVGVLRWDPSWVFDYPPPPSLEGVLWPEERVSVQQMIRSFTINGAEAMFLEDTTGSIEVGKSADMIVVSDNLLTMDPMGIFDARVLLTLFEGKRVFGTNGF